LTVYGDLLFLSVPATFIVALAAALFPAVSILALFFIKNTLKRIYAVMGLTGAFAITAKWLTGMKTRDLFGVIAA